VNVLYYAGQTCGAGPRLQGVIEAVIPAERIERCRTIGELSGRLRRSVHNLAAAILLAGTAEEFADIVGLADLLNELRVILVLPGPDESFNAKALALFPSYVSHADLDFSEVAAVLGKIMHRSAGQCLAE